MPGFSLTPVAGFPPPTEDAFPQFIQFQFDGVNLGGPDADTVNFVPGETFSVTRGTGEDANVITVTIPAGSGT